MRTERASSARSSSASSERTSAEVLIVFRAQVNRASGTNEPAYLHTLCALVGWLETARASVKSKRHKSLGVEIHSGCRAMDRPRVEELNLPQLIAREVRVASS